MSSIKITTSQNIDIEYELAGLGDRIAAAVLDNLIKFAYLFILVMVFINIDVMGTFQSFLVFFLYLPFFFYTLASELLMNGQTVGKRVMNIKVVSLDGARCSTGQYVIRWLFVPIDFYVTFFSCAIFTVAFSMRNQRLGDMIAGTIVIKTRYRADFQQTVFVPPAQTIIHTVTFPEAAALTDRDMELVKEVILLVWQNGNSAIPDRAAEKIKLTLHVESSLEPLLFLQVLLADYNYLATLEG